MKRLLLTYFLLALVVVGLHWSEFAYGTKLTGQPTSRRLGM